MPAKSTKATKPSKASKPIKFAKPSKKAADSLQLNLFGADLQPTYLPRMIPLQVPEGIPITFGAPLGQPAGTPPANQVQAFRTLLALPREEIRKVIDDSGVTAADVINLSTAVHGFLYKFAAIGGKVTRKGPRGPR